MNPIRTIAVAVDFSDLSRQAFEGAADLARRIGADLYVVHIVPPVADHEPRQQLRELRRAEQRIAEYEAPGVRVFHVVRKGLPSFDVAIAADDVGADLLIVAARGSGAAEPPFLGSVAQALVHTAPMRVLVVGRAREVHPFVKTLVGLDATLDDGDLVDAAVALTEPDGTVEIVTVHDEVGDRPDAVPLRHGPTFERRHLVSDRPDYAILDEARATGADLVVVGSTRRPRGMSTLVGSKAMRVVTEAPCPVLVVPRAHEVRRAPTRFSVGPRSIRVAPTSGGAPRLA